MHFVRLTSLMIVAALVASCSTNLVTDIEPSQQILDRHSFGVLSAKPGKLQIEMFALECQKCSVTVAATITSVGARNKSWLPTIGFTLNSEDQSKGMHLLTVRSNSAGKYYDAIKVIELPKAPELISLGPAKIRKPTRFSVTWEGSAIKVEYNDKEAEFDLGFTPYSFGYVASGLTGTVELINGNLVADWGRRTEVAMIPREDVVKGLSN